MSRHLEQKLGSMGKGLKESEGLMGCPMKFKDDGLEVSWSAKAMVGRRHLHAPAVEIMLRWDEGGRLSFSTMRGARNSWMSWSGGCFLIGLEKVLRSCGFRMKIGLD